MGLTYDELRDYLNSVGRLYELTSSFIKYHNDLIRQANGRMIYELPENIRNVVLSGLRSDGEYVKYVANSYALFASDFLGICIKNPHPYSDLRVAELAVEKPNIAVEVGGTSLIEFARLLNKVSKFIIDRAREMNIGSPSAREGTKVQIEDIIEEIIETSYEISVGVHSFTTSIFGLRKITPQYMKKAYGNIPENLLKILGFSKLLNVKDYELWGFPDYFIECIAYRDYAYIVNIPDTLWNFNPELKTLGGAICVLNEIIWRYVSNSFSSYRKGYVRSPDTALLRWYEGLVNIEEEYAKEAWRLLSDIGWSISEYLSRPPWLFITTSLNWFDELTLPLEQKPCLKFLIYDKAGLISRYIKLFRDGVEERSIDTPIALSELLDDLMPAIFLGVIDTPLRYQILTKEYEGRGEGLLLLMRRPGHSS